MEIRYLDFFSGEWLTDVFKREKYENNAIPTNCIFDKTLPGLGATYSEIEAERNSIIIEPNVPVIIGKCEKNKKLLPVHEKTKDNEIEKYFENGKVTYKKILCTPESYMRVRRIANEVGIDLYRDFFCLFDECEKITQDIDYRESISLPIRDFFQYSNKAFVSATPLKLRNPDFKANGFFKVKINPSFEYKKKVKLIVTNWYEKTVTEKLDELQESELVCVFLNSTNGLNKLINYLEEKGIHDYKAFCSIKSVDKFETRGIKKSFDNLDLPLAKYNFFTSRFFSAVDIYVDRKPDILILTDLNEAKYSRIDPFTNTVQIYGRFRNEFPDGEKFKSLTHITNIDPDEIVLSEPEIESYLNKAEKVYDTLKHRFSKETDRGARKLLSDDLSKVTYNRFINDDPDKSKNYFAVDNFYDDETVKGFYTSAANIEAAYQLTNHLIPELTIIAEPVGDQLILKYKRLHSKIEMRKIIVNILDTINAQDNNIIDYVKNHLKKHDQREKVDVAKHIIDAYDKIGSEAIKNARYLKTPIDSLVDRYDKDKDERRMFSKAVLMEVEKMFQQHIWLKTEFINKLQDVFNVYGIKQESKFALIKRYGGVDELKGKDTQGQIKLGKFQPDFEFD